MIAKYVVVLGNACIIIGRIDTTIETIGTLIAVIGSILSVYGALTNNLKHDHHGAMTIWMYSNILLLVWCIGNLLGFWNGGISIGAMLCMYLTFTVSNAWGLWK